MQIVVARYNENIEWTKLFPDVVIYNKGEPLPPGYNEIVLDNVGREGHTYYTHIYNNYDNLDEYTVFLQGNPFDHSPNIIKNLDAIMEMIENNTIIQFGIVSEEIFNTNTTDCPYHIGLPLGDVYERLFDEKIPNMEYEFGSGAQFIVSNSTIKRHPREFYLEIIRMLEYDANPVEGYVIERFHTLIFR